MKGDEMIPEAINDSRLLNQEHFLSSSDAGGLCIGVAENIDMFSLYAAALVFGSVNDSVNHDLCSERNDPRIYRNRMVGPGNGACKGTVD